jgi:hypothetical protein
LWGLLTAKKNKHPKRSPIPLAYVNSLGFLFFSDIKEQLNTMIFHLSSGIPLIQDHSTIEEYIRTEGHELLWLLLQVHLKLRAYQENRQDNIVKLQGKHLTHNRNNTKTTLKSLFGDVMLIRKDYSQRKITSEFPLDGKLNLAKDQFFDGLRSQVAEQVDHCAYDHVVEHIDQTTGGRIAKRECLALVDNMAQNFDIYYLKNSYSMGTKLS